MILLEKSIYHDLSALPPPGKYLSQSYSRIQAATSLRGCRIAGDLGVLQSWDVG